MANAKTPAKAAIVKEDDAADVTSESAAQKIKVRHYIEAGFAFFFMAILRRLSLTNASDFGGWVARWIAPWTGAWRTAKNNIALAMPEFGLFERDRVAR